MPSSRPREQVPSVAAVALALLKEFKKQDEQSQSKLEAKVQEAERSIVS